MVFACLLLFLQVIHFNIDSVVIQKTAESNHIYHFSNKQASFWSGETSAENRHFLTGYISYRERLYSDYRLVVNGEILDRTVNLEVEYRPYIFSRKYEKGITERIFMPDNRDALVLIVDSKNPIDSITITLFGDNFKSVIKSSYSRENRVGVGVKTGYLINSVLSISGTGRVDKSNLIDNDLTLTFSPSSHYDNLNENNYREVIVITTGSNEEETLHEASAILRDLDSEMESKRNRLQDLAASIGFYSSDVELTRAFYFALFAFDALNMNEIKTGLGKGIYAGYPWFQDFWGRDTFIALRALTVTGQYQLAKENIFSFLNFQQLDENNPDFGKFPNRVRPDEIIYNTADATPRLIIEAGRYLAYTNDSLFRKTISPYIERSLQGSFKYRTDAHGFLLHEDADTWMDAKGPAGAYSPRGNRANDIQALWIQALLAAESILDDDSYGEFKQEVKERRSLVEHSFSEQFINRSGEDEVEPIIVDALKSDGLASKQIRINQIFTLPVLDVSTQRRVVEQVTRLLTTPFGSHSLYHKDPEFHPFHKVEPEYEQDASYHNGIIWTWNTGAVVGGLVAQNWFDRAWEITQTYTDIILNGVSLGSLPELADALPRNGTFAEHYPNSMEFKHISRFDQLNLSNSANRDLSIYPPMSGTWSQAWSVSEFVRNMAEHYSGFILNLNGDLKLRPVIPDDISDWEIKRQIKGTEVRFSYKNRDGGRSYTYQFNGAEGLDFSIEIPGYPHIIFYRMLKSPASLKWVIEEGDSESKLVVDREGVISQYTIPVEDISYPSPDFLKIDEIETENRVYSSQID